MSASLRRDRAGSVVPAGTKSYAQDDGSPAPATSAAGLTGAELVRVVASLRVLARRLERFYHRLGTLEAVVQSSPGAISRSSRVSRSSKRSRSS
jgi:hypothetical protein